MTSTRCAPSRCALDYLLKPFDRERFQEALQRARAHIQRDETGDLGRRLLALVKDLRRDQPKTDRLVVKSGGRLFFLRTDEIDWIEAAGTTCGCTLARPLTCCAKP